MVTVLHGQSETSCPSARVAGEHLWMDAPEFESLTGWSLKPEGFCRGDVCVPIPPQRTAEFVDGCSINASAFCNRLGNAVVRDESGSAWAFAANAAERSAALQSLEAADFTLPDLGGAMHSLSQHRGKKVFLVTWASW